MMLHLRVVSPTDLRYPSTRLRLGSRRKRPQGISEKDRLRKQGKYHDKIATSENQHRQGSILAL